MNDRRLREMMQHTPESLVKDMVPADRERFEAVIAIFLDRCFCNDEGPNECLGCERLREVYEIVRTDR